MLCVEGWVFTLVDVAAGHGGGGVSVTRGERGVCM